MRKPSIICAAALLAALFVIFSDFIFDDSKLLLNSDQLNGIGTRFLRAEHLVVNEWDASRLGGLPTLDAIFADAYHPLAFVYFLMSPDRATGFKFILTIWCAFISAFILARYLTGNWRWGALLGFLYAFSPQYFSYIYGGHDGKMMVFAAAPFAMFALMRLLRGGGLLYAVYLALSIAWMILTSHLQLTYFFLWGAGLFTLFELFSQKLPAKVRAIRLGLATLALAAGLMVSAFQIIPPYLYTTQQSVRGTGEKTTIEHSASWSLHGEELAAMALPGFLGIDVHKGQGENKNSYWGQNPFKLNSEFCGTMLMFLALCGCLFPQNRRYALFWFCGSVIALSYAMGLHSLLFNLWYNIIPGVKNFRAPGMAVFWLPLAMLFLAAPVLKSLEDKEFKDFGKIAKSAAALYGGLLLAVLIARYLWESFSGFPAAVLVLVFAVFFIREQNKIGTLSVRAKVLWAVPFVLVATFFLKPVVNEYFKPINVALMQNAFSSAATSFMLCIAVLGISLWIILDKSSVTRKFAVLFIVAAVELLIINNPFIQTVTKSQYCNPNHPVIQTIKKDSQNLKQAPPRVFSLSRQPAISGNVFAAYGLKSTLGFHDNELANYRAFRTELQNSAMLDLTNSVYIVYDTQQGARIEKNEEAVGNAKLYYKWEKESSPEAILTRLKAQTFDYKNTLLLEEDVAVPQNKENKESEGGEDSEQSEQIENIGTVSLAAKPSMSAQTFEVQSSAPAILFISENYHPYWRVSVNGKEAKLLRAFSTFQAVEVPQGKSVVELSYVSENVKKSLWISILGAVLLTSLAGLGVWTMRNKKNGD